MRFDYIPPYTYYRIFNIRKYFTMFWATLGALCVLTAIFANNSTNNSTIRGPNSSYRQSHKLILRTQANTTRQTASPTTTPAKQAAVGQNTHKTLAISNPTKPGWKTIKVAQGDTLSKIFADLDLPKEALQSILTANPEGRKLSRLSPGQQIKFFLAANQQLQEIKLPLNKTKTLNVKLTNNGYKCSYNDKPITKKFAYRANHIEDSLFLSGQKVGLPDKTIMQLADIFGCDVNFAFLRKKDRFKILFEESYIDGKKVNTGNILMAEFTNRNKTYKAIRFTDADGHTGYYSPEGYRMQKAFLRTPVKFTRISSRFSTHRHHPKLHKIRAHKGVDYAAPRGTPVAAAGDGKIIFVGKKNGYGNVIELQHGRKYSTLYAHLSKFSTTVRPNAAVKQGDIIGFVGRTGLATGDHLHYEFRVNGIHRDPLSVTLPKSLPIAQNHKKAFMQHAREMLSLLTAHEIDYLAKNG